MDTLGRTDGRGRVRALKLRGGAGFAQGWARRDGMADRTIAADRTITAEQ